MLDIYFNGSWLTDHDKLSENPVFAAIDKAEPTDLTEDVAMTGILACLPTSTVRMSAERKVRGVTLTCTGCTRVTFSSAQHEILFGSKTGCGVAVYEVQGPVSEKRVLAILRNKASVNRLCREVPNVTVMLAREYLDDEYSNRYFIYAYGHDGAKSSELAALCNTDRVHRPLTEDTAWADLRTLASVVDSPEYIEAIKAGCVARDEACRMFAEILEIKAVPLTDYLTDGVTLRQDVNTKPNMFGDQVPPVYLVQNDAADPSVCDQGVFVWRGATAPLEWFRGPGAFQGSSEQSFSFSTANDPDNYPISTFPVSSGQRKPDSSRKPAVVRTGKSTTAALRVFWGGPTESFNPEVDQEYHGHDAEWETVLRASHSTIVDGTELTLLRHVATVLPEYNMEDMSLEDLVRIGETSGETSFRISGDNPIVPLIYKHAKQLKVQMDKPVRINDLLQETDEGDASFTVSLETLKAIQAICASSRGR